MDPSTIRLVSDAKRGDTASFEALFRVYGDRVYTFLLNLTGSREDAEDLLQETFVTAYRELHTLTENGAFPGWLYTIARNFGVKLIRRQKRYRLEHIDDPENGGTMVEAFGAPNPEELFQREEFLTILRRILQEIPEAPRVAFALVSMEGMSYREASEILGCTEATLRVRMHRARKVIQQKLKSYL